MAQASEPLTPAERKCLELSARGQSIKRIAEQFNGCTVTVQNHLAAAREKLLATTTVEAVARALKLKLIK